MMPIFLIIWCMIMSAPNQPDSISSQVSQLIDQSWDLSFESNDSALVLATQALELSKEHSYPLGEVLARESMGLFHEMVTGDIDLAGKEYFAAIEICEKHDLDYIADLYHSLGIMFHTTDNFENAKSYYTQALEKARKKDDHSLIKKCLINLGAVYSSLEDFDQAESHMKESLEYGVDKGMDFTTYANLGYLYVKQEKFDQAIPLLIHATEENPENPDPDLNLYFLLHAKTMARDSSNMKRVLERASKAAESGQYGLRDQSLFYRNIADYLAFTGNYKEALAYRDKYIKVYEEIKEKQRDRIVLDMETKYETEKKEARLKVLQLEAEKQEQQTRLYFLVALAMVVIAALVGFFLYRNREKNKLLTSQKKQLQKNVDEINLLLREIHHRVKNNLQVITSLLNIQQRSITDQKALEAIRESKNRILTMGLIHRSFYQNKNLGEINTREYVENLLEKLVESYSLQEQKIDIETKVDEVYLDMDTLVPLGLIINEMVSNSLKYAFEEKQNGKLSITLDQTDDHYTLEISDNGSGINDIPSLERSQSFGLKMIRAFVKKINGELNLVETEGTTFRIRFAA